MAGFRRPCGWGSISPRQCYSSSELITLLVPVQSLTVPSMYYQFALLLLFRPLTNYRITGSQVIPRHVCTQAADALQGLLASYAQLYTLKRTPSFVPYFILTSATVQLAMGAAALQRAPVDTTVEMRDNVSQAVNRAVTDLKEMALSHRFAAQALSIVRYLANKANITLSSQEQEDLEILDRAFLTNVSLLLPAIVTNDPLVDWCKDDQGGGASMHVPLFGRLPFERRLLFPTGQALEEAGFQKL